jgi:hypothetical protein
MGAWFLLWAWYPFEKLLRHFFPDKTARFGAAMDSLRWKILPLVISGLILLYFVPRAIMLLVFCWCAAWIARRLLPGKNDSEQDVDRHVVARGPAGALRQCGAELRERVISLGTMDWPLRLITVTGGAQLLASGALLYARQHPGARIATVGIDGEPVVIGRLVVIATAAFLALGWSLILSGGWERRVSRVLLICTFAAVAWRTNGNATGFFRSILAICAAAVVAGVLLMISSEGKGSKANRWEKSRLAIVLSLAIVYFGMPLYFAPPWAFSAGIHRAISIGFYDRHVFRLMLVLAPVLFLAGSDFAEVGEVISRFAAGALDIDKSHILLAIASLGAAGFTFWMVHRERPVDFSRLALLAFALLGFYFFYNYRAWAAFIKSRFPPHWWWLVGLLGIPFIALVWFFAHHGFLNYIIAVFLIVAAFVTILYVIQVLRIGTWKISHVPFAMLAIAAVFLAGTREAMTLAYSDYGTPPEGVTRPHYQVTPFHSPETWSIAYPESWRWTADSVNQDSWEFRPEDSSNTNFLIRVLKANDPLFAGTSPVDDWSMTQVWPQLGEAYFGPGGHWKSPFPTWMERDGKLYKDGTNYSVEVFVHQEGDDVWFLKAACPERYQDYYQSIFGAMARSWGINLSATIPSDEGPMLIETAAHPVSFGLLPALLVPIGLLLLFYKRPAHPGGTPRDMAGLFSIIAGTVSFFFLPVGPLTERIRTVAAAANPFDCLQLIVAGLLVIAVVYFAAKRQDGGDPLLIAGLFELTIGLLFLHSIYRVYGLAIIDSQKSVWWQAVVLVAALLWDLVMSGKEITNIDGTVFRRPMRVMLYVGYVVLVCTCILYLSSLTSVATGKQVESVLVAEEIIRQGVVWLATPYLLLSFLFRIQFWDYAKSGGPRFDVVERWLGRARTGALPALKSAWKFPAGSR